MLMKPEEVKEGLLVHAHTICDDLCPYYAFKEGGVLCSNELCGDALSYIEQLEQICIHWQSSMDQVQKALQDNGFGCLDELLKAYNQVKRERDALLKEIHGICCFCKHKGTTVCVICKDLNHWEWEIGHD